MSITGSPYLKVHIPRCGKVDHTDTILHKNKMGHKVALAIKRKWGKPQCQEGYDLQMAGGSRVSAGWWQRLHSYPGTNHVSPTSRLQGGRWGNSKEVLDV